MAVQESEIGFWVIAKPIFHSPMSAHSTVDLPPPIEYRSVLLELVFGLGGQDGNCHRLPRPNAFHIDHSKSPWPC